MYSDDGPDLAGPTSFNLLFVCTGNTCRSPLAEAVARRELERRGWTHVQVASAGIAAHPDDPASDEAVRAAQESGMDLRSHRARVAERELVEWADLILTMSESHLRVVQQLGAGEKAALLGDFAAGQEGLGEPVSDPFGGQLETYRATLSQLDELIRKALDRLSPILHP